MCVAFIYNPPLTGRHLPFVKNFKPISGRSNGQTLPQSTQFNILLAGCLCALWTPLCALLPVLWPEECEKGLGHGVQETHRVWTTGTDQKVQVLNKNKSGEKVRRKPFPGIMLKALQDRKEKFLGPSFAFWCDHFQLHIWQCSFFVKWFPKKNL